jgi:GntR family transcriptional regulator
VLLGRLHPGDQLPTLSEMVRDLGINQNTVARAYSELEHAGVVVRRQGVGTFIASSPPGGPLAVPRALISSISRWVDRARAAGLSADQIRALVAGALDDQAAEPGPPGQDSEDSTAPV